MLAERFTLIPALAAPRDSVAGFLALADGISRAERVCLVLALQRACDRHPQQFAEYCRALGR